MNWYSIDLSPYLEHHGVPGMKWGVRRRRATEITTPNRKVERTPIKKNPANNEKRAKRLKTLRNFALEGAETALEFSNDREKIRREYIRKGRAAKIDLVRSAVKDRKNLGNSVKNAYKVWKDQGDEMRDLHRRYALKTIRKLESNSSGANNNESISNRDEHSDNRSKQHKPSKLKTAAIGAAVGTAGLTIGTAISLHRARRKTINNLKEYKDPTIEKAKKKNRR